MRRSPLLALLAVAACAAPAPVPEAAPPVAPAEVPRRVHIVLPWGDCATGRFELQVYDREEGRWVAHPEHPEARAGVCLEESSERLLTELRVRCVDPSGRRSPSAWVRGVQLDAPLGPEACVLEPSAQTE
jgi:hypothetical protein